MSRSLSSPLRADAPLRNASIAATDYIMRAVDNSKDGAPASELAQLAVAQQRSAVRRSVMS